MCLALGHNAVMPVRFEPETPRSRVKHLGIWLLERVVSNVIVKSFRGKHIQNYQLLKISFVMH